MKNIELNGNYVIKYQSYLRDQSIDDSSIDNKEFSSQLHDSTDSAHSTIRIPLVD